MRSLFLAIPLCLLNKIACHGHPPGQWMAVHGRYDPEKSGYLVTWSPSVPHRGIPLYTIVDSDNKGSDYTLLTSHVYSFFSCYLLLLKYSYRPRCSSTFLPSDYMGKMYTISATHVAVIHICRARWALKREGK